MLKPLSCFRLADNKDVLVMLSDMDINAIAGTLKLYFRELPEPLLTDRLYPAFMEGIGKALAWACSSRPRPGVGALQQDGAAQTPARCWGVRHMLPRAMQGGLHSLLGQRGAGSY